MESADLFQDSRLCFIADLKIEIYVFYSEHDRLLVFELGLILFVLENAQLSPVVRLLFKDDLTAICMLLTVASQQKAKRNSGGCKNQEPNHHFPVYTFYINVLQVIYGDESEYCSHDLACRIMISAMEKRI